MADLDRNALLEFLIGDFEAMWRALVSGAPGGHRGNFTFALQSMLLLELSCRGINPNSLDALTAALRKRDARYFTLLPGDAPKVGFDLPGRSAWGRRPLMHALFDLVRNGLAHQYQQMSAVLGDGQKLNVSLTGADRPLPTVTERDRPAEHLRANLDKNELVWITVRTDILFLDLRDSVRETDIPRVKLPHLASSSLYEKYSLTELVEALRAGDHFSAPPQVSAFGFRPTILQATPSGLPQQLDPKEPKNIS